MTANSIKAEEVRELKRSNQARERETERSNREKENLAKKELPAKYLSGVGSFLKGGTAAFAPRSKYSGNHPTWYTNNEQLVSDSATLSTVDVLGPAQQIAQNGSYWQMSGICRIGFAPTLGRTIDKDDIVTTVTRNIYTFVRHANSGHSNYDAQDLQMYLLAMDSLFMLIGEAERAYKAYLTEDRFNRYVNPGLRRFLCPAAESNLADFRMAINSAKLKIGSLVVPADISYYARHAWLVSNVFRDNQNHKAQLYYYVPKFLYKYDEEGGTGTIRTNLVAQPWNLAGITTIADWTTKFNELAEQLLASESIQIMSGDLLKAYGENGVLKLQDLPADSSLEIAYDEAALTQLHNTTLVGAVAQTDLDVKQDTVNGVIYQGAYPYGDGDYGKLRADVQTSITHYNRYINGPMDKQILSFNENTLDGDKALVYTRNKVTFERKSVTTPSNSYFILIDTYGTEVFMSMDLISYNQQVNSINYETGLSLTSLSYGSNNDDFARAVRIFSGFDWAPAILIANDNPTPVILFLYEIKNYKILDERTLSNMHKTAIYSEFNVKQMGKSSRF